MNTLSKIREVISIICLFLAMVLLGYFVWLATLSPREQGMRAGAFTNGYYEGR